MNEKVRVVSYGAEGLLINEMNEERNGYTENAAKIEGLAGVSYTITTMRLEMPADNNPLWMTLRGAATVEGTIKLRGVSDEQLAMLSACVYKSGEGLNLGEIVNDKFFGFSYKEIMSDGTSLLTAIFCCYIADFPKVTSDTIEKGKITARDVELTFSGYPVDYPKADNGKGTRTLTRLNSKKDKAKYDLFENKMVYPTEILQ